VEPALHERILASLLALRSVLGTEKPIDP